MKQDNDLQVPPEISIMIPDLRYERGKVVYAKMHYLSPVPLEVKYGRRIDGIPPFVCGIVLFPREAAYMKVPDEVMDTSSNPFSEISDKWSRLPTSEVPDPVQNTLDSRSEGPYIGIEHDRSDNDPPSEGQTHE
jgi:hypothetical protein